MPGIQTPSRLNASDRVLQVPRFEREAWVEWVLKRCADPDIERYL